MAVSGHGGFGDTTDGVDRLIGIVVSADRMLGGTDRLYGMAGEDVLIGGTGNDAIDGGTGRDLVLGDNALLDRTASYGDFTNPRFRTLLAGQTQMYSTSVANDGAANVGTVWQLDPNGAPVWGDFRINLLDHTATTDPSYFGSDYLAGGAGDDMIFGQLGNDTIQGDGTIDGVQVSASRDSSGTLHVVAVAGNAATDGADYIEGGGGSDVIFGGLGPDDIIGGSSNLFNLQSKAQRPDVGDLIFGGDGMSIDRSNDPAGTSASWPDSDTIVGDNGNIFRLVSGGTSGSAYLRFNYDPTLIPRPVELLDYTPGGPDYRPDLFPNMSQTQSATSGTGTVDVWGADEIHGGLGNDTVYGGGGNDVIFGDAGGDDLIGGWGHDWISGGSGQDGILGDDGHIFTSRNGLTEPLNGVTVANVESTIATPGKIQQATIYPAGELTKVMDLFPYALNPAAPNWLPDPTDVPEYADDLLFGGLGSDWIHGGAGVDGISGAEALPTSYAPTDTGLVESDWYHPLAFRNILRYGDARSGMFDLYDQYDPLRRITLNTDGSWNKSGDQTYQWLLNFDSSEGPLTTGASPANVPTDGNDVLFGDYGADWLVGGTGNDTLYGGWGNDLLNADDNLDTNGYLNNTTDTNSSYEDRAFGGAGLDVLIGNTGGDRLIDWVGEFNSYLVPFAPFGMATVSRTVQPALMTFLYQLSQSQGADPYIVQVVGGDPARNGEPLAELGVVSQSDPWWHDQTGGPRDPQAGNVPGGKRDVLRSATFTTASTALNGFYVDSGSFQVSKGVLAVTASDLGGNAAAVFNVDDYLPVYYEVAAQLSVVKPTGGWKANAFIIFDYQSATDFKFAGIDVSINKLVIGHRTPTDWVYDTTASVQGGLKYATWYTMLVAVNGTVVTLVIDNKSTATYTFGPRVIDGKNYGLNKGMTGMGSNNSRGQYDNVAVQVLPPQITYDTSVVDLAKSTGNLVLPPASGAWTQTKSGYSTTPSGGWAVNLAQLGGVDRLAITSWVDVITSLSTSGAAGLVFDYYAANDFKFAIIDVAHQQAIMGHVDPRRGWTVDSMLSLALSSTSYTLELVLKGASASLTVNGSYGISLGWNAGVSGGRVGLLAVNPATFVTLRIRTDDPAFLPQNSPLLASAVGPGTSGVRLTPQVISAALATAEGYWVARGYDPARFAGVLVRTADLGGSGLGVISDTVITVSTDAAGWGWALGAVPGHIDLVTVLAHELGHLLGLQHTASGVMAATLNPGESWVPASVEPLRTQAPPPSTPDVVGSAEVPVVAPVAFGSPLAGRLLAGVGTDRTRAPEVVALAGLLTGLAWAHHDVADPFFFVASGRVCDGLDSLVA